MELFIFDLDDTLFKKTAKVIVRKKNNIMRKLSNAEYINYQLQDHEYYDFSEFKDANIFNETATPIHKTLKILKEQLKKESDVNVIIVTARRDFDNKELFLSTLEKHGIDTEKLYVERAGNNIGMASYKAKKLVFEKYLKTKKYTKVTIYDDLISNIRALYFLGESYPDIKFCGFLVKGTKIERVIYS